MNALLIVLPILALLMFELGLVCRVSSFAETFRSPRPIVLGLVGQMVAMPVLAIVCASVFKLEPAYFIGLVLIACSPGGSSSNVFSMLARGNVALSILLTSLSSVLVLVTLPLIMQFVIGYVDRSMDVTVHLPVGKLLMQNLVLVFLPFLSGVIFRHFYGSQAEKVERVLSKAAFPSLMLLAGIFFVGHRDVFLSSIGNLGVCVLCFIVLAFVFAAFLCRAGRLSGQDRRTIIIEVVMQNAAQAIAVASGPFVFHNDTIAVPAIFYALLMNVVLLAYVAWYKKMSPAVS